MITAVHALIYSDDAAATRRFFKDVLRWPSVSDRAGSDQAGSDQAGSDQAGSDQAGSDQGETSDDPNAWLIFNSGPSELGVHPTVSVHEGKEYRSPRQHTISLICDDLDATMAELAERGAEFNGDSRDMGFGIGILVKVPGADDILLYQAHYPPAHS